MNPTNSEQLVSGETEFFDTYGIRVLRAMRQIIRAIDIHSRKLHQGLQITSPQMVCLYSLGREGTMTLSQLAQSVSLSASTTTGIVDRLENKGLVTRTRGLKDRRKVDLNITQTGQAMIREAPALLQDRLAEALRNLPELEQAAITLSLERIVELMGAGHLDAAPHLVPQNDLAPTAKPTTKESTTS